MNQDVLQVVWVAVVIGAMYFLFIAPQRKQRRQMAELLASLVVGDEVITAGGIYGRVRSLIDDAVVLEIAEGVEIRIARSAIVARTAGDRDAE